MPSNTRTKNQERKIIFLFNVKQFIKVKSKKYGKKLFLNILFFILPKRLLIILPVLRCITSYHYSSENVVKIGYKAIKCC